MTRPRLPLPRQSSDLRSVNLNSASLSICSASTKTPLIHCACRAVSDQPRQADPSNKPSYCNGLHVGRRAGGGEHPPMRSLGSLSHSPLVSMLVFSGTSLSFSGSTQRPSVSPAPLSQHPGRTISLDLSGRAGVLG